MPIAYMHNTRKTVARLLLTWFDALSFAAVFLYSYAPGVSARRGSPGTVIRLPSSAGE